MGTEAAGAVAVTVSGCSHAPSLICENDCGHSLGLSCLFADPGSECRHVGSLGRKHCPRVEHGPHGEPPRNVKRSGADRSEAGQADFGRGRGGAQGRSCFTARRNTSACRTNRTSGNRGCGTSGSQYTLPHKGCAPLSASPWMAT